MYPPRMPPRMPTTFHHGGGGGGGHLLGQRQGHQSGQMPTSAQRAKSPMDVVANCETFTS
jgi:hypothetical protein